MTIKALWRNLKRLRYAMQFSLIFVWLKQCFLTFFYLSTPFGHA